MEMTELMIGELHSIKVLMSELLKNSRIKTNASVTKEYDTSITTEKNVDTHDLLGGVSDNIILSVTILDPGGGLSIRLNNDDEIFEVFEGDNVENEIIHKIGIQGSGAGTAKIRYGIHIPENVRN